MHKDIVSLMHGVCCYGRGNKTCITPAPRGCEETQLGGGVETKA